MGVGGPVFAIFFLFFFFFLAPCCDWQPHSSIMAKQMPYFKPYSPFPSVGQGSVWREGGGRRRLWKERAGREGKAPQMKILNQHALPLQLRPRRGLHLIYSPKPGNQAIKRNQTIRFPALNCPTVWCGQLWIRLNPLRWQASVRDSSFPCPRRFMCCHSLPQGHLGSVLVDLGWHTSGQAGTDSQCFGARWVSFRHV